MDYEVTSPTGKIYVVTAPEGATEDQVLAYAQSEYGKLEAPAPQAAPEKPSTWGGAVKNVAQGLGHFGTSVVGGLAGDVAGLGALTGAAIGDAWTGKPGGSGIDPMAVKNKVANALTYQPDDPNSTTMKVVQAPGKLIQGAGDYLGEKADSLDKSGNLGHIARAAPLAVAAGLGVKAGMPASITAETPALVAGKATTQNVKVPVPAAVELPTIAGKTPAERAETFVRTRTNLDFTRLSAEFKKRLEQVAATGKNLERLDATAIERQGLLASLERPISNPTRGQVTRDPLQQRTEQLAKATEAGKELADIDIAHNKALIENLDVLRSRTNAKATGDLQTGKSVQEALRGKKAIADVKVRQLYKQAEEAGELQGAVQTDKLVDYLRNHDDPPQVSYALNRLKQLGAITQDAVGNVSAGKMPVTLKEMEGIRRAAGAAGKSGGTAGHYASELKRVIDEVTEGTGGEKYKAARAARKAVGDEFERQSAVARLVSNRKMSRDRATALEDTWHKTVMTGSLEDLQAVRKSLGDSPNGTQAWADLKAATVDYIKDKATGGQLGLKNQAGDSHATWAGLKRAVDDIGPDKLREIFGEADAKRIETLVDAAQILKTEAPMNIKGSPTMDKILTFLDRVGSVPGLGKASELAGGTVKGIKKISEIGKAGREVRKAQTTPLDEARK